MPKFPRVKPGDPITAEDFNAIAEALEKFSRLTVVTGGGLLLNSGPQGKVLGISSGMTLWAVLSGSTSPYSWQEVEDTASGGTSAFGRAESGNAYEINAVPNLGGKVVPITWTAAADWRFQFVQYGPTPCNWTFTIRGCASSNQEGTLIEIQPSGGGAVITSCTTISTGVCTLSVPLGSYDVVVTPQAGSPYNGSTSTLSHSSCGQATTITLNPTNDYVCGSGCCTIEPKVIALTWIFPPGYAGYVWPDDTLTWNGSSAWIGAGTHNSGDGNGDWVYNLNCVTGSVYGLRRQLTPGPGVLAVGSSNGPQTGSTCSPFHITKGTLVGSIGGSGPNWHIDG